MISLVEGPLIDQHKILGAPIPAHTPHAIVGSLPTWADNHGYVEGDAHIVDAMSTGYPRFFIHRSVRRLTELVQEKLGREGELCLLLQTARMAVECRDFIVRQSVQQTGSADPVRVANFPIYGPLIPTSSDIHSPSPQSQGEAPLVTLHAAFFLTTTFPLAKLFWTHTGMGITSRFSEHCLFILFPDEDKATAMPWTPAPPSTPYTRIEPLGGVPMHVGDEDVGEMMEDANAAKRAIKQRIVELEQGDTRTALSISDVYLFPTGMQAVFAAHKVTQGFRPGAKSVFFGFLYMNTLKILGKFGPGYHFLGHGRLTDLSDHLATELLPSAVFTECSSNPLLETPDFRALRALADQYDLLIVIDATVGNMCNVDVLPYADIVVHSLSKIFNGCADVTGGSLTLNPAGAHYTDLQAHIAAYFEDTYFGQDLCVLERNSRGIAARVAAVDANAEAVADFLRMHTIAGGAVGAVVKDIFYPKWTRRAEYDAVRRKRPVNDVTRDVSPHGGSDDAPFAGGFGGLLSLTFVSLAASRAFFDTLGCYKGISFGTRFTLACPYVFVSHYRELAWAASLGVEEGTVRISVGCEERVQLMSTMSEALAAAQDAVDREEMKSRENISVDAEEECGGAEGARSRGDRCASGSIC